jgi:hypothetical protein
MPLKWGDVTYCITQCKILNSSRFYFKKNAMWIILIFFHFKKMPKISGGKTLPTQEESIGQA